MKARGALCLALLLAALGTRADDADGDDDDLDLDLDDVDLEGEDAGPGPTPPVEDFDLGIPEEDRRKMMASCWLHTINRVQLRKTELDAAIEQMVAARRESGMSSDQAMNTMLYGWMMACYLNIDGDGVRKVTQSDTQAMESDIFGQRGDRPQQVSQASQRQWELLETTIKEQQSGGSSSSSTMGSGASGGTGGSATYALVVFAVIFGLGALVVLKLVRADQSVQAEKDAKRAEKAEKKLSKKKTK
jgi:hypothetical protein